MIVDSSINYKFSSWFHYPRIIGCCLTLILLIFISTIKEVESIIISLIMVIASIIKEIIVNPFI